MRVIRESNMVQVKVKHEVIEVEEKLTNLTMQRAEEIKTKKAAIIKEVEGEKAASQNFISEWKSTKHD
jgi:hypothetical protein